MLAILSSCGSEKATTYTFDKNEYEENLEKYVNIKGEMDAFSCDMTGLLFNEKFINAAKSLLKSGKSDDQIGLAIFELFGELYDDDPYLSIKVTESEVEWIALSEKSKIESNKFSFPIKLEKDKETLSFTIIEKTEELLILNTKLEDDTDCNYPFKSIKI